MLDYHKEKMADVTISVIEVPWEEASRFGIMNTAPDGSIKDFEEKPANPKNNLASMGIYIFNWKALKKYLEKDEKDPTSSNDFGKNIIPKMLNDHIKMFAYFFKGYWKDVGTIESFWEANMDLLSDNPKLNLHDPHWNIYSANPPQAPNYFSSTAKVRHSLINDGCMIFGEIENSILFPGVYIGTGSKIKNSIIMPNAKIEDRVIIENTIIGEKTIVCKGSYIGCSNIVYNRYNSKKACSSVTVIGDNITIPPDARIEKNQILEDVI
jgi:glucose-1-phosphate adenylyltransferase